MSVFDFDSGPLGKYTEKLTVSNYSYYSTPLRPSSGNDDLETKVAVNRMTHSFSSTVPGTTADNPSDPTSLTDVQAERGLQLYFKPKYGFIDATFSLSLIHI